MERVEWCVGRWHLREFRRVTDGPQSVFGLTTARKLARKLGPGYEVRQHITLLKPEDQEKQAC